MRSSQYLRDTSTSFCNRRKSTVHTYTTAKCVTPKIKSEANEIRNAHPKSLQTSTRSIQKQHNAAKHNIVTDYLINQLSTVKQCGIFSKKRQEAMPN